MVDDGLDDLPGPEPGIHPEDQLSGRARPADPTGGLAHEPLRATPGSGRAFAHPGVQDLAGPSPGGQQRMKPQHPGVAVGGALLGVAVDLTDRGVDVDEHRRIARSCSRLPRAGERRLGHLVELADVPERQTA
jgi:hypothetical protein